MALTAKESKTLYSIKPKEKHFTSTVFLLTKETPKRVLLVHHKKFDKWMPPGGHKEFHENPVDTAIREVSEETGIEISDFLPPTEKIDSRAISIPLPQFILEEMIDSHKDQPEHYHLDMIYTVEVPHQEVKCCERESHDIRWFTLDEVHNLELFENVKKMIIKCLAESNKSSLNS